MKKTLTSSKILLAALFALGFIGVYKGYSLSNNLTKKAPNGRSFWLIGKGPYFSDTIKHEYNHLVSDFTLLELLPRLNSEVQVDGYENGKRYVDITLSNDTLYVNRLLPDNDTSIVRVNDDYAVRVQVGAASLRSITLRKDGKLSIPARPYGSDLDGIQVFKPEVWDKYVLRGTSLDLYLEGSGTSEIFTEVKNLRIHKRKRPNYSSELLTTTTVQNSSGVVTNIAFGYNVFSNLLMLHGSAEHLEILHPEGELNIDATSLEADSVTVISSKDRDILNYGMLEVNCSKYLEADLLHNLDVLYMGDPVVNSQARGYGRVIKKNSFRN